MIKKFHQCPWAFWEFKAINHFITINYRGQDKRVEPTIGQNPNANIEDEYIHNLQQQIHFMELELKILKEKITEDEKNTGIGSLFKDEKTSHQHIGLLKTKY